MRSSKEAQQPHSTHSPLYTTHLSPLTSHHSPLTTHLSPLTTHHSLPPSPCLYRPR